MSPVVTPDNERWAIFEDEIIAEGFTQIPNVVLRNPRLSMQAKYLYALLLSYAWDDPYSHPGLERMKKDAGVKKADTLRDHLYQLRDAGVMDIIRRGQGKTNIYIFKALVTKPSTRGSETRSSGDQETRHAGLLETRSSGGNIYTENEYSPTNKNKRGGKKLVRAKDLDDIADKWDHLIAQEPYGPKLQEMAEILAEANTTGTVAVTRCWRELAEPFIRYYEKEPMGEDAWLYGFEVAIGKGVGNIRYARNAARNYRPSKKRTRKGGASENGSHQQSVEQRTADFRRFIES